MQQRAMIAGVRGCGGILRDLAGEHFAHAQHRGFLGRTGVRE
jgi:hypothetical protein